MIELLDKIINKKVIIQLNKTQVVGASTIHIEEDGELSEIKQLEIKEIPDDSFAFTLDFSSKKCNADDKGYFGQLSPYFDKGNGDGINKSCDLVIVSRSENKFIVVLFDQKSKKPDLVKTNMQLENSKIFFLYLINVLTLIYDQSIDVNSIEFRKALGSTRIIKRTVNVANDPEFSRRNELRSLGIREVSIKRTQFPEKGWLNYSGLVGAL